VSISDHVLPSQGHDLVRYEVGNTTTRHQCPTNEYKKREKTKIEVFSNAMETHNDSQKRSDVLKQCKLKKKEQFPSRKQRSVWLFLLPVPRCNRKRARNTLQSLVEQHTLEQRGQAAMLEGLLLLPANLMVTQR
jgi:hypothetical protein